MESRDREDLRDLFAQFMGAAQANAAADDVRIAERILETHAAPEPDPELLDGIKRRIAASLAKRRANRHAAYRSMTAAAAVVVLAVIGLIGRFPANRSDVRYAALLPPAIWDGDDIASDDQQIVYFNSELQRIEAQVQALEAGEAEYAGSTALDDVEMELLAMNVDFWRE
jgi:hypothetical protein